MHITIIFMLKKNNNNGLSHGVHPHRGEKIGPQRVHVWLTGRLDHVTGARLSWVNTKVNYQQQGGEGRQTYNSDRSKMWLHTLCKPDKNSNTS